MSFRPQTGSRRSAARQFSKSAHEKKAKEKKQQLGGKYHQEETEISAKEVVEKNLGILSRFGNQIFALSPFSQYFDDWLVNLRQIISEFESNPAIKVDEQFVKERSQIFLDVEGALAEKRLQETNLTGEAKELADNNHLLVETDKEYAEKTRELSFKRNADVQRLSTKIRELEDDVAGQEEIKIRFYKVMARRKAAEKLAQTKQDLKSTKNELEVALQGFTADQEKLHDYYEKKKQEITDRVDALHKELEKLETDTSIEARQAACNALANAINALLQRTPLSPEHAIDKVKANRALTHFKWFTFGCSFGVLDPSRFLAILASSRNETISHSKAVAFASAIFLSSSISSKRFFFSASKFFIFSIVSFRLLIFCLPQRLMHLSFLHLKTFATKPISRKGKPSHFAKKPFRKWLKTLFSITLETRL